MPSRVTFALDVIHNINTMLILHFLSFYINLLTTTFFNDFNFQSTKS